MDLDALAARTLRRTWGLHQTLFTRLEKAVEESRVQFDPSNYDPWYFSHSVRYKLCRYIDEGIGLKIQRIPQPMSGIDLAYLEFRFKVWKANGGEMPIAGYSTGREQFLRQPMLEHYLDALGDKDLIPLNLFLGWDTDKDLHLKNVNLVCPKDFESPWKPGEEHFLIPVPHPATQFTSPKEFTEEPGELEIPLERKRAVDDGSTED
jgi:hypothetical protein